MINPKKRSHASSLGTNNNQIVNAGPSAKRRKHGFFQKNRRSNETNEHNTPTTAIPPEIITGYSFQFTLKTNDKASDANLKFITFRGSITDTEDGVYQIWRRVHGVDTKDIKMSPSWLFKQTVYICKGILMKLFRMKETELKGLLKKELLSLCYQKLGMTKANKKLKEKQLMMFTDEEIKIILSKLQTTANICDLETELFNYFASVDIYVMDEHFMDMLDDLMTYKSYAKAVKNIYDELLQILISTKTDTKFETKYAAFFRKRMETEPAQQLIFLLTELYNNDFRTYPVNKKHYCSIFVCTIKEIFLQHLTIIVYGLLEGNMDNKIDNNCSEQQAGSYGGASLCSCFRLSYCRTLSKEKRVIYVRLQKQFLCKENKKHLIPIELKFQNMGGMYQLSPSVYPFCQRILSDLSKHINQALLLPSNKLPPVAKLIHSYVNNQRNIEEFKGFFSHQDLSKYNEYISTFMQRFVKFMCGKYYWSKLKQQEWCEVGMGIRDQFNFGHTEFTKKRKMQK
eukprot:39819_1